MTIENRTIARVDERLKMVLSSDALTQAGAAATGLERVEFPRDVELYADLRAITKAGVRFLDQEYKAIADPLNMALRALRERVMPQKNRLEEIVERADRRHRAWQDEEKRRVDREREEQNRKAREAAADSAKRAEQSGEEPPPPAVFPQAEPPKALVRGATGRGVTTTKLLNVELVGAQDLAAYAPGLLKLDAAGAKNLVRGAMAKGDLLVPEGGQAVYFGIKVWYEQGSREA